MHTEMWDNPAVQANMATLAERGFHVVGPDSGALTGEDVGVGRMADPLEIARRAQELLHQGPWSGKKVLISAGGTREALDPVRFMGNRSTGVMGVALARQALRMGAEVTLVHAHLEVPVPAGVIPIEAGTSQAMREVMLEHSVVSDVVIMAAAVSDWTPAEVSLHKLSTADAGETWAPALVRTPDILSEIGHSKTAHQLVVGFAAETSESASDREARGRAKLAAKNVDALVVNQVGDGVGFGAVDTAVTLFFAASPQSLSFDGTKTSVAERLLEALQDR
jgi:phosphopantothenoylcysteine decarboxylase/phosphopantothenate--cysteine ligase